MADNAKPQQADPSEEKPPASSIHAEDNALGESDDRNSSVDRTIEEEDRQAEHAGESSAQQRRERESSGD